MKRHAIIQPITKPADNLRWTNAAAPQAVAGVHFTRMGAGRFHAAAVSQPWFIMVLMVLMTMTSTLPATAADDVSAESISGAMSRRTKKMNISRQAPTFAKPLHTVLCAFADLLSGQDETRLDPGPTTALLQRPTQQTHASKPASNSARHTQPSSAPGYYRFYCQPSRQPKSRRRR
ncbi:MAG: hypothetical protein R2867_24990 [Caldilineaceae bacterium]